MDRVVAADAWCILRMSGPRTLPVARSLAAAGIEVWAPSGKDVRRVGPARKRVERDVPLMPTFAFARARHLPELARALALPINPHPAFSIFRWNGRIPLLSDRDMRHLRTLEERELLKAKRQERHVLPIGSKVKVQEGAFTGMSGIVEESDGKHALVAFGGSFRVRVASWLLHADQVENTQVAA